MPTDATATAVSRNIARVVRTRRAAQGQSLGDLARASGLSKTILARIERGEGNPSVETLWRLSRALHVPLGELIAEDAGPVQHIPHRSGESLQADSGMRAWLVHADGRERRSELFELDLPTGIEQRSEPHLPGTEELIVCQHGRVLAGPLGDEAELGPGDAVRFAADAPHRYVGIEDGRALCWMLYAGSAR